MAASDEADVVLNQSNTHSESSQTGHDQIENKRKEMVKLGNTQVNRGSKNVSLRHLYSESAELVTTCAAV